MRKLVLVVDDDEGLQETLQAALEFEDYDVVVAEDGLEALEKPFDIPDFLDKVARHIRS